jgi:hypothetical protein
MVGGGVRFFNILISLYFQTSPKNGLPPCDAFSNTATIRSGDSGAWGRTAAALQYASCCSKGLQQRIAGGSFREEERGMPDEAGALQGGRRTGSTAAGPKL